MIAAFIILALVLNGLAIIAMGIYHLASKGEEENAGARGVASFFGGTSALSFSLLLALLLGVTV